MKKKKMKKKEKAGRSKRNIDKLAAQFHGFDFASGLLDEVIESTLVKLGCEGQTNYIFISLLLVFCKIIQRPHQQDSILSIMSINLLLKNAHKQVRDDGDRSLSEDVGLMHVVEKYLLYSLSKNISVTKGLEHFEAVLQCILLVITVFPFQFKAGIGIIIDQLLNFLSLNNCSPDYKIALIEFFKMLLDTPKALISVYASYDLTGNRPIYQKILSTLVFVNNQQHKITKRVLNFEADMDNKSEEFETVLFLQEEILGLFSHLMFLMEKWCSDHFYEQQKRTYDAKKSNDEKKQKEVIIGRSNLNEKDILAFRKRNAINANVNQALRKVVNTKRQLIDVLPDLIKDGLIRSDLVGVVEFLKLCRGKVSKTSLAEFITLEDEDIEDAELKMSISTIRFEFINCVSVTSRSFPGACRELIEAAGICLLDDPECNEIIFNTITAVYIEHNPWTWITPEAGVLLANAMMMITISLAEKDMTLEHFTSLFDKYPVFKGFAHELESCYHEVLKNPLIQHDVVEVKDVPVKHSRRTNSSTNKDVALYLERQKKLEFKREQQQIEDEALFLHLKVEDQGKYAYGTSKFLLFAMFKDGWREILELLSYSLQHTHTPLFSSGICSLHLTLRLCGYLHLGVEKELIAKTIPGLVLAVLSNSGLALDLKSKIDNNIKVGSEALHGKFAKLLDCTRSTYFTVLEDCIYSMKETCLKLLRYKNILQIQRKFDRKRTIAHVDRYLVHYGPISKLCKSGRIKEYNLYLFDDLLLYSEKLLKKRSTMKIKKGKKVDLEQRIHQVVLIHLLRASTEGDKSFKIEGSQKVFTVICKDRVERDLWLTLIKKQQRNPNSVHEIPNHCALCFRKNQLIGRKKCGLCKRTYCKQCVDKQLCQGCSFFRQNQISDSF